MAFLVKSGKNRTSGPSSSGFATIQQYVQVTTPASTLPQTGTAQIFRVLGGRVLVHRLIGTVTTVMTATDPVLKLSSKALTNGSAVIGTAVDIASTANLASKEVGSTITVLGSGGAYIINNAGAGIATLGLIPFVLPQGEVYITTGGSNVTGAMNFDIFYQPLDPGATVVATTALLAII